MSEKIKNYICSLGFMLFGAFMYIQALPFKPISGKDVGSGFVPKVLAVAIILTAALELINTIRSSKSNVEVEDSDNKGGLLTIACICAYVLLYDHLGFLISTIAYLFVQMTILSNEQNRKLKSFALISVLATVFIYLVFNNVIGMQLPAGILEL